VIARVGVQLAGVRVFPAYLIEVLFELARVVQQHLYQTIRAVMIRFLARLEHNLYL